jgi:hypothetical protein
MFLANHLENIRRELKGRGKTITTAKNKKEIINCKKYTKPQISVASFTPLPTLSLALI